MSHLVTRMLLCVLAILFWSSSSGAEILFQHQQTIQLDAEPIDITTSPDGQRTYVLFRGGLVEVRDATGTVLGSIQLPSDAAALSTATDGSRLYASFPSSQTIQVLSVELVQQLDLIDSPVKGPVDAPITVAVFSDFQCPYCARLGPLLEQLLKQYPTEVRVAFKHYPLRNHQFALPAAQASMAAAAQGKFWEYHDLLFENSKSLSEESLLKLAQELELDIDRFNADRHSPSVRNLVQRDMQEGNSLGVRGTPTLFINGRQLQLRNLGDLLAAVQRELARQPAN